ncbi:hypothetical protein GF314_01690, partial [bacterium]|nr:hypothetical protein [bacterium]
MIERSCPRPMTMVIAAALSLGLTGCAVGPDYARPDLATDVPAGFAAAEAPLDSTLIADQWWRKLGDARLDSLVDRALAHNQSLRQATAAVLESRAAIGGARSARLPSVEIGATANRSQNNLSGFGIPRTIITNSFDASATGRFELDLWGRLARTEEAARASLLASEANRRVVVHTLVADVVRTWLEIRELQCQLGLNLRTLASYRQTVETVEQRFAGGVAPALEVRLARQ